MKKFKLLINPFAEKDIEDAKNYYDEQKEGLGEEFVQEVKKTVKRIKKNPFQFPKEKKEARKVRVDRFPFGIFFIEKDLIINVFSVFHFSRNPKTWENRIDKK